MKSLLFSCLLLAVVSGALAAEPDAAGAGIEFGFLNGVYEDLDPGLEPIRQGGIIIHVSSPEHRLTVHRNRLTLEPAADDTLAAAMEAELEGAGRLVADIEGAGTGQRVADDVELPRQVVRVEGVIRLERDAVGYRVTVVEADRFARLEVKSGLAGQTVAVCRVLEFLPFVDVVCDGLERALSVVLVPVPGRGEEFLLRREELSEAEQGFLDGFLPPSPSL